MSKYFEKYNNVVIEIQYKDTRYDMDFLSKYLLSHIPDFNGDCCILRGHYIRFKKDKSWNSDNMNFFHSTLKHRITYYKVFTIDDCKSGLVDRMISGVPNYLPKKLVYD